MKTSVTSRSIWNIASPIIFGNLAQTIITFTDTAFLGHLGIVELGASMMSGIYYYVFSTLAWGFAVGVQIIVARRLGEGNLNRIGVVFEHGLVFVLGLSLLIFLLLHYFTNDLLRIVIDSPGIYSSAVQYMDYRHYGIFFVCFNYLFRSLYIGLSDTKIITYSTVLMAIVNIFLDYCLIFGKFGFPEMGVSGAALASVCAEVSALIFFVGFTVFKLSYKKYALFSFHKFDKTVMMSILKLAFPTMLQRLFSFGTWFLFFVFIESMGELPVAISGIVRSVYMLICIPVFAFGATANTFVSRIIGEGKQDEVMPTLFKIFRNSILSIIPLVAITLIIPEYVAQIYTSDIALSSASVPVLYVICFCSFMMSFAMVFFEAVSGTGNTVIALSLELFVLIFYGFFIWTMTNIIKADIQWVWLAEFVYALLIGIASLIYLKYAKWQTKKI